MFQTNKNAAQTEGEGDLWRDCRLCGAEENDYKHTTIEDEALEEFLKLTAVTLSRKAEILLCKKCKGNVKIVNKFISEVIQHQKTINKTRSNDILKSFPKGITIKAVFGSYDPLQFDSFRVKSEPVETSVVKREPMENFPTNVEPSNSTTSSDDDGQSECYEDDEDFIPTDELKSGSKSASMKKVADLNFTCANCKVSYDDFETLTTHITSRACSNPTKCRFCPKKFDNKRKLYAHQHTHVAHKKPKPSKLNCTVCHKPFTKMEMNLHMETHVKVVKKGFTFRCIKCRAAYNSHLDLIQHMNDDHPNKNKKSKVVN